MTGISYRSGKGWFVAMCAPQQQKRAKSGIIELGHEVYMPVEKVRQRQRGKLVTIERPLFGPYIFFSLDPHKESWSPILAVDGVQDILRSNGCPSRVPEIALNLIRRKEQYGEFDKSPDAKQPFDIGQEVRIGDGQFSGMRALVQEFVAKLKSATASKRARVLVEFLGRAIIVDLPVCDLEPVPAE